MNGNSINLYKIEPYLAYFCCPVLTGIKPANLFTYPMDNWFHLRSLLSYWNFQLSQFEKYIIPLSIKNNRILLFVYDKFLLKKQLEDFTIIQFLNTLHYPSTGENRDILLYLSKSIQTKEDFPHEIGIFLGYPFDDVIAFIKNKGMNYLCAGYWKVYYNKQEALELFHIYNDLRTEFYNKLKEGMTIPQIISLCCH